MASSWYFFLCKVEELRKDSRDPNDRRDRREAYQAMSVLYWEAALDHLKMMARYYQDDQQQQKII